MPVEPAVGEVSSLHDVGYTYSAKALGTKQRARYCNNTIARLGGLLAAYPHDAPQPCGPKNEVDNHMMVVMNKQANDDAYHLKARDQ